MSVFPNAVTDHWRTQFGNDDALATSEAFVLSVNAELPLDRRVMVLRQPHGAVKAVLTPALSETLGLRHPWRVTESAFREMLHESGITLHGADYLFYVSEEDAPRLLHEETHGNVRRLTRHDGPSFQEFQSAAMEEDLDAAFVELDHWAVIGSFEAGRLVCAASMYPWQNTHMADLGVLTLEPFRGKGHARAAVRSICKYALQHGYQPQYRCQVDNHASAALAIATGLTLFGTWEVISPSSAT
jgi:RimJ/RimL family protein N-acetyltransferase